MTEPRQVEAPQYRRPLTIIGLSTVAIGLAGVGTGMVIHRLDHDHDYSTRSTMILAAVLVAAVVSSWLLLREMRRPPTEGPLTPMERKNRNILVGSALLGGVMSLVLFLASDREALLRGGSLFSDGPLPPLVAAMLIAVMGLILPLISYYWHRTVDEQEVDAYKTGALYALYAYLLGAPIWWLAWRGGFAPEPNGIVIFFATVAVMNIVWLWKKYR